MSLISFTAIQDGVTGVNAAATNNPLNTIYNDYNGNITDANIASNAAIAGSKISYATVANPYKFSVYRNASWTSSASATVVNFDTKLFDTGSNVDVVTNKGRFTAPIAGFYWFAAGLDHATATSTPQTTLLYKNGSATGMPILGENETTVNASGIVVSGSAIVQLSANDYVEIYCIGGGGSTMGTGSQNAYFMGFLLSAT